MATRDDDGNLIISYADGSNKSLLEGDSTYTDPFGVVTKTVRDEAGEYWKPPVMAGQRAPHRMERQ